LSRDTDISAEAISRNESGVAPEREGGLFMSVLAMRRIGIVLAVVVLCGAAAGCVSDMVSATSGVPDGSNQLRYYGGPKYPMWSSQ
jgi:hypothetical protein